jgi:gas vesicle protein
MIADHTGSIGSSMKEQLREAASDTKEQTLRVAEDLKERLTRAGADCKERVADRISNVGDALRGAAEKLRDEGDPNIAEGFEAAAQRVSGLSEYLHECDLTTLQEETAQFTRRNSSWVYGGLLVAGFALSRLLRASSEPKWRTEGWAEGTGGYSESDDDESVAASVAARTASYNTPYASPSDSTYVDPNSPGSSTYPETSPSL